MTIRQFDGDYRRIVGVDSDGEHLVVRFANGDDVELGADRLLAEPTAVVLWDTLQCDEHRIWAESTSGPVELPWDAIRTLTDRVFAAEMASEADAHARRIGLRIRSLRESRGLSSKEVAERAGIAPQSMSRIELGRHDVVFTTLERILAAMGYRLRDLAVADDPKAPSGDDDATPIPSRPLANESSNLEAAAADQPSRSLAHRAMASVEPQQNGSRRSIRILHLSDLHAPAHPGPEQKQIIAAALTDISGLDRQSPFDLVMFSGDLATDGTTASLQAGRTLLLDPLARILPGREIFLTPGNHDIDRAKISPVLEAGLQHQIVDRESLAALEAEPDTVAQATRRLEDWHAFVTEWRAGSSSQVAVGPFVSIHSLSVGGCSIGIAGLNSAWRSSGGADDRGRLIIGEHVLRPALDAIDDSELRLVLMHHPVAWLADFDAASSRTLFETKGVFVFTGHEHTLDPASEMSTRGAALYSRAGALYAGHSYSNSYTILDLDPTSRAVRVTMRRWWPAREAFDAAIDLHREGSFELPWPTRTNTVVVHQSSFSDVVNPLAQIAQEQSLIAGELAVAGSATVSDLLIAPRFWPVPNREAMDATLPPGRRPKPIDPIDRLRDSRVVIVSGEHSAGVTSSLLWILEQHFRLYGTLAPAYVRADERLSRGRLDDAVEAIRARLRRADATTDSPVLLAIDDIELTDRRAQARLMRFLSDNPEVTVILGCHDDQHVTASGVLEAHSVAHTRVFLAPFGRRELRQLITRIAGPDSTELVHRVLNVIHGQGLARNPLNVAALVAVVTREDDLTELNESGLLQSYVTILLENPVAIDPEGLAMDYRRREYFLSQLAAHLVEVNQTRIPRGDTEQFVLQYFERLGWRSVSAGHLIDSLIRRRVLSETETGVGFRYQALLHLFAAKWLLEDRDFGARILSEPVRYADIVRHAAGLRRSDRDLLTTVSETARRFVGAAVPGVDVGQFELITDRQGWSQITDLEHVRQLVRPAPPPPTEEELDKFYEDFVEDPTKPENIDAFPVLEAASALEQLGPPVELLASVLKSSELVADVELKVNVARQVIEGWSLLTILLAVREDETRELRGMLATVFGDGDESGESDDVIDHFSRVLVVTFMTYGLYANVGSRHLQTVTDRVLDDSEFMGDAANALFATMLCAMLGFPGWPERLGSLHRRHPRHPMVGEVARRWALARYTTGGLDPNVRDRLEAVLVEMFTPAGAAKSGPGRLDQQNQIREWLKTSRRRARWIDDDDEEAPELQSESLAS